MVLQNDQKSYAENSDAKLFAMLAESLKQPLNGIARTAELLRMQGEELAEQSPELLESIFSTSTQTIKIRHPDINRDGKVNAYDTLTVLRQFNAKNQKALDFNDDAIVSKYDVLFVLDRWAP